MNANEGLIRIAKVVRWLGYSLAAAILIGTAVSGRADNQVTWGVSIALSAFFGVGGWVLAWIIEGFAKPKE